MGTRCNPFEKRVYESEDPLETGGLYLFDSVSRRGLELLPFLTVMPSPEQSADACYVLSRATGAGAPDGFRITSNRSLRSTLRSMVSRKPLTGSANLQAIAP